MCVVAVWVASASSPHGMPGWVVFAALGAAYSFAWLTRQHTRRVVRRRVQRITGADPGPISLGSRSAGNVSAQRGVGDYFDAIRSKKHGWLQLATLVSFAGGVWVTKGLVSLAVAAAAAAVLVFPVGFFWWRRWGP